MPTRYKVALFLITFLVIFLAKPTSSYAAELDHPPVVTSITGPTSGYYGQTYSFTTAATAADGYTITTLFLQNDGATFSSKSAGASGCTGTDCSFTGNFTPPTTGTFIIHAAANYTNGANSDTCNSYSGDAYMDCQNSGDKYITFVVTNEPATPTIASMTGPASGVIGSTFTYNLTVTATVSHPIDAVAIYATTDASNPESGMEKELVWVDEGASGCSTSSCTVSGSFTPLAVGTYIIFAQVNYGTTDGCKGFPGWGFNCINGDSKYITLVVGNTPTTTEDLPDAGILSGQTKNVFIGLGFITLGLLTTQIPRIMNVLGLTPEKRRSRFENRFK